MLQEICEEKRNTDGTESGVNSPAFMITGDGSSEEEFGIRELLCTVAASYDKIDVGHGNFLCSLSHVYMIFHLYLCMCQFLSYAHFM